jgi:hypothetical protein
MAIQILDFRLSFVWFETNLALLENGGKTSPYGFLARATTYQQKFEMAKAGVGDLHVPWRKAKGNHLWEFYLGRPPGQVDAGTAFKALMPFRGTPPGKLELKEPWWSDAPWEAFYYPYGVGFVVNVRHTGACSLEQAVETAFEARKNALFDVDWGDGVASLSVDALADAALPRLRRLAFGKDVPAGTITLLPLSVFTVVQAEGIGPDEAATVEVHRSLEAVCSWRTTWRNDALPSLDVARVGIKQSAPPANVLYGTQRGRAVWFPPLFLRKDKAVHALACYHKNLTLLSLHVEGFSGFLSDVAARLNTGAAPPQYVADCAKKAVAAAARLYVGVGTYRSGSARAQLDRNGHLPAVKRVLDFWPPAADVPVLP